MPITGELSTLRVLLADDDTFVRRVTASILNNLNIGDVLEAEDGEQALSMMKAYDVDLLITDIQMPKMNGIQLLKRIRSGKASTKRDLRAMVITSFSYTDVLGSCLALDVNGFLVKPITPENVETKIRQALAETVQLRSEREYQAVDHELQILAIPGEEKHKPYATIIREEPSDEVLAPSRIVDVRKLQPGMVLLRDIKLTDGNKLLGKGNTLTPGMINRLNELKSILKSTKMIVVRE